MDKVTLHTLQEMKTRGERITMLTAYDYPSGLMADASGVDMILVGDSAGMVVHGFPTTNPVTMEMMLLHCSAVRRGVQRAHVIGDMPFGSYQIDIPTAKRNAARLVAECGVDSVKLEGGLPMAETVRAIVEMGVAVHGHIGLTPQSVSGMGGFKVQGRSIEAAQRLIQDALALQDAGAYAIVLEGVPNRLAALITRKLTIPTIGIGAGVGCDGQVLVMHDVLGLNQGHRAKFVKQYGDIFSAIVETFKQYNEDVRAGTFPTSQHEYTMSDEAWQAIESEFGGTGNDNPSLP